MILAEKIVKLRKQQGWSQEELSMRLGVSRQSVSKWESTVSIPDLDKIIKLSELFGVSTDYLLKDSAEEEWGMEPEGIPAEKILQEQTIAVSLDEANTYMALTQKSAGWIAAGVFMCIVSPILLILFSGNSEYGIWTMTEQMAAGFGVTGLFLLIAAAVAIFIVYGMQLDKYEYLEKEAISLEYGIAGIVEVKKEQFANTFQKCITSGVVLCILSVIPVLIASAFEAPEITAIYAVCLLLALVAVGVYLFVWSGMIWSGYQKLLEEGDYTREKKLENKKNTHLTTIYWCSVTAVYLFYSFYSGNWAESWIIWPSAGVFFAALLAAAAMIRKRR